MLLAVNLSQKNALVSGNAGDEKYLYPGGRKFTFLIEFPEIFSFLFSFLALFVFFLYSVMLHIEMYSVFCPVCKSFFVADLLIALKFMKTKRCMFARFLSMFF